MQMTTPRVIFIDIDGATLIDVSELLNAPMGRKGE